MSDVDQQISFCQDLGMLMNSGSDLDSALGVIVESRANAQYTNDSVHKSSAEFTHALAAVRAKVRQGEPLSDALSEHPRFFDRFFLAIVKSGEASGALPVALTQLREQLERDQALREKIRSALIYPIILVAVMSISLALIMTYILPRITDLFATYNGDLSGSAQLLLAVGNFSEAWGGLILLGLATVFLAGLIFADLLQTKKHLKALLLRVPMIRRLNQQLGFSRFSSSLSSLLSAGLTQVDAMTIAAEVFNSAPQRQRAQAAIELMRAGQSFSQAMRSFPELALYYAHSIESGEKSGQLAESLGILAERMQHDFSLRTQRLTLLLEPTLIVLLGLIIGFVIITIFSTIQTMGSFQL